MKKLFGYFLKGLLFLLPVFVALYILRSFFIIIFPLGIKDEKGLIVFFLTIFFITFLGFIISRGIGAYFRRKVFKISSKLPFVRQIINSVRKFLLILNFSKEIFEKPVMIKREQGKEIKLGFVTKTGLKEFGLPNHSSVYIPNPFSFLGEITVIANEDLEIIKGNGTDISNFILSGGLSGKK